jgi:hypothetical protein
MNVSLEMSHWWQAYRHSGKRDPKPDFQSLWMTTIRVSTTTKLAFSITSAQREQINRLSHSAAPKL